MLPLSPATYKGYLSGVHFLWFGPQPWLPRSQLLNELRCTLADRNFLSCSLCLISCVCILRKLFKTVSHNAM